MRRLVPVLLAACSLPTYDSSGSAADDPTDSTTHGASTQATGTDPTAGEPVKRPLDLAFKVLRVDDVDGDSHLDLLLDSDVGPARLVRGHGDGNFDPPLELGDPKLGPGQPLGVGDFNGDGTRDLTVWIPQSEQLLLTSTGLGGVLTTWPIVPSGNPTVADLNADGRADLVTVRAGLRPHLSAIDGQPIAGPLLGLGGEPGPVHVADLDADGALDLVVANRGTDDLSVLRGDGLGNFAEQQLVPVLAGPRLLGVADLDADGTLDLLVSGRVGLLALRGLGDLNYEPIGTALPWGAELWWYPESAILCDRDGDPYSDVLVLIDDTDGTDHVAQLHGGADARFRTPTMLDPGFALSLLACADFDEDGRDDYISFNKPDQAPQLVLNPG